MRLSPILFVLASTTTFFACSSKDDSPQDKQGSTADAGNGTTPPPGTGTTTPPSATIVTIAVTGKGRVVTKDGAIDCASDGVTTTGVCTGTPPFTLYEAHEFGTDDWAFDHWEPSMTNKQTLSVAAWNPPPVITGVFVQN